MLYGGNCLQFSQVYDSIFLMHKLYAAEGYLRPSQLVKWRFVQSNFPKMSRRYSYEQR